MKREQIARDIHIVDGTPEGQRVINYLLDFCHVLVGSMPDDCDPHKTLFNEGQRSVGNEIASLLSNEPHRFRREAMQRLHDIEGDE